MMKAILLSLVAIGLILSPVHVFAQDNLSSGKGAAAFLPGGSLIPECISTPEGSRTADASCVTESIVFYTNVLLFFVAVGAFFYMLYGAFLFATALGDDSKIVIAKKTVTHAIVGIIIAGMAALLVGLLRSLLGAD